LKRPVQEIATKNIFLAEDDIDDQEFLKDALESLDHSIRVDIANTGEKALNYLDTISDEELPCLVILDYNLPQISGFELLKHLNTTPRFNKITKVVWSTSNSPYYQETCLASGAKAYFIKPSDMSGIKKLAEKMLELCG
jgi:CheY-like chemotaxis protein